MAKRKDRQKAINLRKQGKTYGEIKKKLNLSKSTLSDWLSNYPLTKRQLLSLEDSRRKSREVAIEKCSVTKKKKREKRFRDIYQLEKSSLLPLTKREIYLIGLFLYWGEGLKNIMGPLSLSNTDPSVVKFYLFWLVNCLGVPREKIKVAVHLYSDMDVQSSLDFWSKDLFIPLRQFSKPYIKKNKRADIDQKGFGRGTCNLVLSNARLKEKVIMGIKAISDYYTQFAS